MSGAVGTRNMRIDIDGVEYSPQATNCRWTSGAGETDTTTFEDARKGGSRAYTLSGTGVQNTDAASLWSLIFDHVGEKFTAVLMPHGNLDAPTVAQPWFEQEVTISEPDGDFLGGEANASSTARQTFEFVWVADGRPRKVTAIGG